MGEEVGWGVGRLVGSEVGTVVGTAVGCTLGAGLGWADGVNVMGKVGAGDGAGVGTVEHSSLSSKVPTCESTPSTAIQYEPGVWTS